MLGSTTRETSTTSAYAPAASATPAGAITSASASTYASTTNWICTLIIVEDKLGGDKVITKLGYEILVVGFHGCDIGKVSLVGIHNCR